MQTPGMLLFTGSADVTLGRATEYAKMAEERGFRNFLVTEAASDALALTQHLASVTSRLQVGTAIFNIFLLASGLSSVRQPPWGFAPLLRAPFGGSPREAAPPNAEPVGPTGCPGGGASGALAGARGPGGGNGAGAPPVCGSGAVPLARGHSLARPARAGWRVSGDSYLGRCAGGGAGGGAGVQAPRRRRRQRVRPARCPASPRPSPGRRGKRGAHEPAGLGRARGGLRPKLPAPGAALGKPPSFPLTPGQASARAGAETLRPE